MGRASSLWSASLLAVGLAAAAVQVPAGARLEFRLTSKITTQTAKPKDAVTAVVISPVMVGEEFVLPAGAKLSGTVEKSVTSSKPDERSTLVLAFTELEVDGAKYAIQSRVTGVDNARETVDEQGAINGILAAETLSGRIDEGLSKLAERSSGFAGVLATVKKAVLNAPEADITYEPGTDLELELTAPVSLKAAGGAGPASKLEPLANEDALYDFVNKQPFQTYAETPPKPSDVRAPGCCSSCRRAPPRSRS
jgi:hypothetical protein